MTRHTLGRGADPCPFCYREAGASLHHLLRCAVLAAWVCIHYPGMNWNPLTPDDIIKGWFTIGMSSPLARRGTIILLDAIVHTAAASRFHGGEGLPILRARLRDSARASSAINEILSALRGAEPAALVQPPGDADLALDLVVRQAIARI